MTRCAAAALLLLAACGSEPTASVEAAPARVVAVAGDGQAGPALFALAEPIAVRVENADGEPLAGVTVAWAVENREAALTPATSVTDADGVARATWRLGVDEGAQLAVANVANLPAARFTATAASGLLVGAAGGALAFCGRDAADVVRCWEPPPRGGGTSVPLDTDLRFATLAWANGEFCGTTRDGAFACVREADLAPGGTFRPDAAPVRVLATGMPAFTQLAGAGIIEEPTTWCGVTGLGAVHCWGDNRAGQAGTGVIGGEVPPPGTAIPGLAATTVAVAGRSVCALGTDRRAWCWGDARRGAVDAGGAEASPLPVAVPTAQRFVSLAGAGAGTFCAVSEFIQAWCWGANDGATLGRNTLADATMPAPVEGTEGYVAITATGGGFLALTVDRDLVVWGGLAPARTSATPFRILRGYLFTAILAGGGDGGSCLRYALGGIRCLDRRTAVTAPPSPPPMHGAPE